MPLRIIDATISDFEEAFQRFKSENRIKFLLFLADKDPSTSLSWCPDCNVAEPVIYEKLGAAASDVLLLRAYVGDRPTWRDHVHPWKVDTRFKLRSVPTLIRWEDDGIADRLEDNEAPIESRIEDLLAI